MPSFIEEALTERGLTGAYRSRPPYQQNDYIGWIMTAKRKATLVYRISDLLVVV
jgi:hypothetical protein